MIPPATTPLIYLLSKRSPDGAKRHPGSARKHGPTASPGSTTYASARRHRKTDVSAFAMGWPLQACYPGFRHSASRRAFTPVFDGLWTRVNAL
jgi:hypothetical protein